MRKRIAAFAAAAMAISLIALAGSADAATTHTTTTAAYAAHPANHGAGNRTLIAPPAPPGASSTGIHSAAAVSPSASPAQPTQWVAPGATYYCGYGDLCISVWDPTIALWKVFFLYDCHFYSVYNWNGTGYYFDNQTPGTVSNFYDYYASQLFSITPERTLHSFPADPVWYVRNC